MASAVFGLAILRPRLMLARMMFILLSVADAHAELLPVMMVRHHGSRQHDHADQQKKVCGKSATTFHHSRVWCKVTENLCLSNEFRKFLDAEQEKSMLSVPNARKKHRYKLNPMRDAEIIEILFHSHSGGLRCFKHEFRCQSPFKVLQRLCSDYLLLLPLTDNPLHNRRNLLWLYVRTNQHRKTFPQN